MKKENFMKQAGTTTIRENECKNVFRNTDTANRQKAFTTLWINHINEKENSYVSQMGVFKG